MKTKHILFILIGLLLNSCAKDVIDLTGTIKGTIKNSDGTLMEDCIVSLNPTGKSYITGTNGSFEFSKLDPVNYTLTFRKEGYSDQKKAIEVVSGMISNVDIILEYAYGTIKGIVKDEKDGHSIENCQVSLSPGGISKMTEANGYFIFDQLSAGTYTLTYKKEGYADQTKSITVVAGKSVDADVALKQAYGSIRGIVRDKDDRHAIENCLISVSPSDRSSMTTADGAFEFTKLLVGDYTLVFERAGYSRATRETKVTGGDIIDLGEVWLKLENPIAVSQNTINFYKTEEVKTFTIHNNCDGNCTFEFSGIPTWLSITPQQGTIEKQSEKEVRLTVNRDKADYGEHTKDIKLSYEGRATGEIPIKVIMEKVKLTQPEVTISNPEKITVSGFDISGNIVNTGGSPILDYGHCWSRNENPTIEDHTNSLGECNKEKSFTSSITGLDPYTTYYCRAYARNAKGVSYSKQLAITTLDATTKPEVSISSTTNISETGFDISGKVESTGGLSVTDYGHCWSLYASPTVNDNKISQGSCDDATSFTSQISNLESNTTYYVRAYAVNAKGISYSSQTSVKTKQPLTIPEVLISSATNIKETSFDIKGEIASTGGSPITSYGHCWSTNENPTIYDSKSNYGRCESTGSFTTSITGLSSYTTYYIRAYAENAQGISYSSQTKVSTLEPYSNKWNGNIASSFAGGSGTKTNPYLIETGGQLLLMKNYNDSYFKLLNNIDLNNNNWLPFEFEGKLDGNDFMILNLRVSRNDTNYGLFSEISNALIENLTIKGVDLDGGKIVGAIAASSRNSEIGNCHLVLTSNSKIKGIDATGGLIGEGIGNNSFYNCTVNSKDKNGSISGSENVGGIMGTTLCTDATQVLFSACSVSCDISATTYVGGILGFNQSYCHDNHKIEVSHIIKNCEFQGKLSGESNIGGILGATIYKFYILSCKADADIFAEEGWAGGIIGAAYPYRSTYVQASYSIGTITSTGYKEALRVGGIVGGAIYQDNYGKNISNKNHCSSASVVLSYSATTSSISSFQEIGSENQTDCIHVANCSNVTTYFNELYSDYAKYWNFNNEWTWSGTVNGQTKQVKCPRLKWE